MKKTLRGSGAFIALLLFVLLVVSSCGGSSTGQGGGDSGKSSGEATQSNSARANAERMESSASSGSEAPKRETVKGVTPDQVLSDKELNEDDSVRDYKGWTAPAPENYKPATAKFFVGTNSSAGAIPAVKPFNFGRNPGGPEDKTMYLTIPKLGITGAPVYDSVSEEALKKSTIHIPATGFPWQKGANVYIAGHRLGYPNTGSLRIFYDLPELVEGDEIILKDSSGTEFVYRMTKQEVVPPGNVEVMSPVEGKSVITLQTCTLPDYKKRVIVRGELVEQSSPDQT